ncbi:hypothetical protein D3875_10915 [Deinococcus cavernae]|uniref:Uncharacterized protein n=1 Tax=Deinococcus cavernae TaxID=2320857 RepID=A0A418V7B7_9DEIO|nr:hypothetical protein D3875_10915 [Deinococcus cavernae]
MKSMSSLPLEQFSELRALGKGTPERSILRPALLNSLALLGQNHCVLLSNALMPAQVRH